MLSSVNQLRINSLNEFQMEVLGSVDDDNSMLTSIECQRYRECRVMNTEYVVQVDDDESIGRHSNHNHHRKMAPQIALYCNTNTNIANRTRYLLSQWQSLSPSQSYSLLLSIVLPNSVSSLMRRLLLMRAIIKRFLWLACCIRRFPIFPPLYHWLSHAPASAATLREWPQLVLTLS